MTPDPFAGIFLRTDIRGPLHDIAGEPPVHDAILRAWDAEASARRVAELETQVGSQAQLLETVLGGMV